MVLLSAARLLSLSCLSPYFRSCFTPTSRFSHACHAQQLPIFQARTSSRVHSSGSQPFRHETLPLGAGEVLPGASRPKICVRVRYFSARGMGFAQTCLSSITIAVSIGYCTTDTNDLRRRHLMCSSGGLVLFLFHDFYRKNRGRCLSENSVIK